MTVLLVLIYAAFISLGIPDSLLGAAWPAMHTELHAPLALAGTISMAISFGTVVSSLLSAKVIARFGTGRVTAVSVLMTGLALLGFHWSTSYALLLLCAIPLGLGAGAIDAGLNNFVALHYQARHMNWMHCFWGIGASLGPLVIGAALTTTGTWRNGYLAMALVQAVFAGLMLLSLPLWRKAAQGNQAEAKPVRVLALRETMKLPLAKTVFLALLCYCGAEASMGLWGASFLVDVRQIAKDVAATWVSMFYLGITIGRMLAGFLSIKLRHAQMIFVGTLCALTGIGFLFFPAPQGLLPVAFFLVGMGFAPIFPAMLHQTPQIFGEDVSQSMMGVQMAMAYVGTTFAPPLFGLLSGVLGLAFLPAFLGLLSLVMLLCTQRVGKRGSATV